MFVEVLVEGESDAALLRAVLPRAFSLVEGEHFRLHPHEGKGKLPASALARPSVGRRGLLDQLPAKLRAFATRPKGFGVAILVDADRDDCYELKEAIVRMIDSLPQQPHVVLTRIAVEETESWFIADPEAVEAAYPHAATESLRNIAPDAVVGAAERLGASIERCAPQDVAPRKKEWATALAPHLDIESPRSPSFRAFLSGFKRTLAILADDSDSQE